MGKVVSIRFEEGIRGSGRKGAVADMRKLFLGRDVGIKGCEENPIW
jgi:hypothetical protein